MVSPLQVSRLVGMPWPHPALVRGSCGILVRRGAVHRFRLFRLRLVLRRPRKCLIGSGNSVLRRPAVLQGSGETAPPSDGRQRQGLEAGCVLWLPGTGRPLQVQRQQPAQNLVVGHLGRVVGPAVGVGHCSVEYCTPNAAIFLAKAADANEHREHAVGCTKIQFIRDCLSGVRLPASNEGSLSNSRRYRQPP